MADFLPVAPAHIHKALWNDLPYNTKCGLFLAHDVVANKSAYEELARTVHWDRRHMIMDNSVIELGDAVSPELIAEACDIIGATTYVLPDVLMDCDATIDSILSSFKRWQKIVSPPSQDKRRFCIIPQGTSKEEWIRCLAELTRAIPIGNNYVGIPRNIREKVGISRTELVPIVRVFAPYAYIHLMGFSNDMIDDLMAARMPSVTSIDSAVPLRISTPFHPTIITPPRGDWWEKAEYSQLVGDNVKAVQRIVYRS